MCRDDSTNAPAPGQVSARLCSKHVAELTFTLALTRALKALERTAADAAAVFRHPPNASLAMSADHECAEILGNSSFILENFTGLEVDYWISSKVQSSSPHSKQGRYPILCLYHRLHALLFQVAYHPQGQGLGYSTMGKNKELTCLITSVL